MKQGCIDHFNEPRSNCIYCEIVALKVEHAKVCEALKPGTAPAIVHGLFAECERLGIYKPTGEQCSFSTRRRD